MAPRSSEKRKPAATAPAQGADRGATPAARATALLAGIAGLVAQNRLDEAEQAVTAALREFPQQKRMLRHAALIAEQRGDLAAALERWAELRKRAPEQPIGYTGALRALRRAKHLEQSPPIIAAALEHCPDDIDVVVWAAELAEQANRTADADTHWQRAIAMRPDKPEYALSGAMCLIGQPVGRHKRMGEVLRRLSALHEKFPDFTPAYTAHIGAMRETQELEEADRHSAVWCARFPGDVKLALARVGVLEEQRRFADAAAFLEKLRHRVPPDGDMEAAYARALSGSGKHDEAEHLVLEAAKLFPRNRRVLCEFAHIAQRRGEWDLALRRLLDVQAVLPDDQFVLRQIQQTRLLMADAHTEAAPVDPADNLAARFESLGGTSGGCEFGIVQRRMGSDTVGLLRWTRIDPGKLIAALDCEFEGVGAEENTVLHPRRIAIDSEEWSTTDTRFGMETHTFVRTIDVPEDKMFAQTCRRLRFLRGKMVQDLREASKIFTYKALRRMNDADILALHAALARYGDNALLVVMRADATHKRGSLRDIGRGVYVGYISHFMKDDTGNPGFDLEGWQSVCAEADARWSRCRPRVAVPEAA